MDIMGIASAGLTNAQAQVDRSVRQIIAASNPDTGGDVVDLSTAAVALVQAKTQFGVGVRATQAADEMMRSAIEVLDPTHKFSVEG